MFVWIAGSFYRYLRTDNNSKYCGDYSNKNHNLESENYSHYNENSSIYNRNEFNSVSNVGESRSKNGYSLSKICGMGCLLMLIILGGLLAIGYFFGDDSFNYNHPEISFTYPGNLDNIDNHGLNSTLYSNQTEFHILTDDDYGYSIDGIYSGVMSYYSLSKGGKLIYKNSTTVNGMENAYDVLINSTKEQTYSRLLIFINNDTNYVIGFTGRDLDEVNRDFNIMKNSLKI